MLDVEIIVSPLCHYHLAVAEFSRYFHKIMLCSVGIYLFVLVAVKGLIDFLLVFVGKGVGLVF